MEKGKRKKEVERGKKWGKETVTIMITAHKIDIFIKIKTHHKLRRKQKYLRKQHKQHEGGQKKY